jgi:peptidoglycan/LPS O-acetylase OafA/YrhL
MAERSPRLAVLDALRFTAAATVVGFHYVTGPGAWQTHQPLAFPTLHKIFAFGFTGVQLFFVISGFVICMSSWGRSLSQFFVSRVVRLYPAYWFAVILTSVVLTFLPDPHPRLPLGQLIANLTMLQEPLGANPVDGVYWTLWRELLFYLLFAAVVWRGVTYRRVVGFCLGWLAASIVAMPLGIPAVNMLLGQEYAMYFVAGIAFYLMHRFGPNPVLWAILGLSYLLAIRDVTHGRAYLYIVTAIFAVMTAVALGWFDRINWRWLSTLGSLTYPLYLLHAYIGTAVIARFSGQVPKYPLLAMVVVGMLLLSWLVVKFVERPLSRLMRRRLTAGFATIRRWDAPAAPTSPAPTQPAPTSPVTGSDGGTTDRPAAQSQPPGPVIPAMRSAVHESPHAVG